MNKATKIMKSEIQKLNFYHRKKIYIKRYCKIMNETSEIKNLLIQQIESKVKWRESIKYMIENGIKDFIEIGPGKVLSGLIKRIDKGVKVSAINNEEDIR